MPAAIQNPIPDWMRQENASVLDPAWMTALRKIASLVGANDPQAQVAAMAAPMDVGPVGGIMGAFKSLAQTLKPSGQGTYAMRAPNMRRMESLYQAGAAMPNRANWSGNTQELMQAVGGDPALAERFLRLIGATSPNTSVPVNTREALSMFTHGLENPGARVTVPEVQGMAPARKVTMAPSKVPNINNALAGDPLSGDKVEAFSQLMLGRPRIPIDVHALNAVGSSAEKLDPEYSALRAMMTKSEGLSARGGLTNSDLYQRVERAMADALSQIAPDVPTNESFATMWEGTRSAKGLKPQGGPIDILRAKGLLQDAAMLDPERLRAALKTAGWTAPAVAAVMNATSAASPETSALEPE